MKNEPCEDDCTCENCELHERGFFSGDNESEKIKVFEWKNSNEKPDWVLQFIKSGSLKFFSDSFHINTSREWITGNPGDSIVLKNHRLGILRRKNVRR